MSRLFLSAVLALSASGAASADPLLEMMRALSKDGPIYSYEMVYSDSEITAKGLIDPSQPEGQRITVTDPDASVWSEDFREGLEEMEAETDGDIWCNDFAEMVPRDAVLDQEDAAAATYAFTPVPEADADKSEKKMMKKLDGTVTLDKADGAVLAYKMVLPAPYKPAMVVKINTFELAASCARAPDGRTYVETFNLAIDGSAMMQSFNETVSRTITTLLEPVG